MYVVVNSKSGNVFGPFDGEQVAIEWAKQKYTGYHSSWYVEIISKPH